MFKVIFFLFLGFVLISGCRQNSLPTIPETDETHYRRGDRMLKENRYQEALQAFLKVIDKRKVAPESHLNAGRICLDHMKDPVTSIYHFKKYLEFKPQSEQSDTVRQLIETATKEFAARLPGSPYAEGIDRIEIMEKIKVLEEENLALKESLARMKVQLSRTERALMTVAPGTPVDRVMNDIRESEGSSRNISGSFGPSNEAPTRPSTYRVEEGDTLSRISSKVFGTTGRWMDIYQANRDQLDSPHDLKVGQTLRIP